jgi:hypothetical protein
MEAKRNYLQIVQFNMNLFCFLKSRFEEKLMQGHKPRPGHRSGAKTRPAFLFKIIHEILAPLSCHSAVRLSNLKAGTGMAWAGQVSSKAVLLLTTILVRSSVLANLGAELPTGSAGEEGDIFQGSVLVMTSC